jgi:UPF0716 protein FxsA
MTVILLILLIAVPLLEIAVLIKVGSWIGFWPAFGIVIGTFILGASILARSGLASALRVQEALVKGEPPMAAMLDGALLAVAGIMLATPGFISDCLGLALLVPPVRRALAAWMLGRMHVAVDVRVAREQFGRAAAGPDDLRDGPGSPREAGSGPVIEGEFERLEERTVPPGKRRPPPPDSRARPDGA